MGLFPRTAATGLYDLRPGGSVFRELSAYEAAFALLSSALERCEASFFSPRADRAQLERLCILCGFRVPAGMELSTLREASAALARGPGCTPGALESHFRALGADLSLREHGGQNRVLAEGLGAGGLIPDNAALLRLLAALLPVSVGAADNFGSLSWERLDASGLTAAQLDEKDLAWAEIDAGQLPENR